MLSRAGQIEATTEKQKGVVVYGPGESKWRGINERKRDCRCRWPSSDYIETGAKAASGGYAISHENAARQPLCGVPRMLDEALSFLTLSLSLGRKKTLYFSTRCLVGSVEGAEGRR